MESNLNFVITLIGNKEVGKSRIVYRFQQRQYPLGYKRTSEFFQRSKIVINDQTINLKIYDARQSESHERFRSRAYPKTDGFIICFSLGDEKSFNFLENTWHREIMDYCPDKPYILVGAKSDIRRSISKAKGESLKRKISAASYIECSALLDINITPVFESIVKAIIRHNELLAAERKKKSCCLLI